MCVDLRKKRRRILRKILVKNKVDYLSLKKVTFVPHFDVMIYFILLIFQLPIIYIECIFSKKDRERENWGIVALGLKFFASSKRNDS